MCSILPGRPKQPPAQLREYGALDLYDESGCFLERLPLAGDYHTVALDPPRLMPAILRTPCRVVLLRHSHVSGSIEPSLRDIRTTRCFSDLLGHFSLKLHDHLIHCGGRHFSFRAEGLL